MDGPPRLAMRREGALAEDAPPAVVVVELNAAVTSRLATVVALAIRKPLLVCGLEEVSELKSAIVSTPSILENALRVTPAGRQSLKARI
jgi:hypothetical protein